MQSMNVTHPQKCTFYRNRQIQSSPFIDILAVHVATVSSRSTSWRRIPLRSNCQDTYHRFYGDFHLTAKKLSNAINNRNFYRLFFLKILPQHAEFFCDQSHRTIPIRQLNIIDMHLQCISWLCTIHIYRPIGRVDNNSLFQQITLYNRLIGKQILKTILRFKLNLIAGFHMHNRFFRFIVIKKFMFDIYFFHTTVLLFSIHHGAQQSCLLRRTLLVVIFFCHPAFFQY